MLIDKRLAALTRRALGWTILNTLTRMVLLGTGIAFAFLIGRSITSEITATSAGAGIVETVIVTVSVIVLMRIALTPLTSYFSVRASQTAKTTIRRQLFRKLFEFEDPRYTPGGTSAATSLAVDAVESLDGYFGTYLSQLFYALTAPVVLFVVIATIDLRVALLLLVLTPITVILIGGLLGVARRRAGAHFGSYQSLATFYLESVDGLDTLALFQRDADRAAQLHERAEGFRQTTMRLLRMQLSSIVVMDAVAYGGAAAGILATASAVAEGRIDFGQAAVILLLTTEFFLPMRALGSAFHIAMTGVGSSRRIFALLDSPVPRRGSKSAQRAELPPAPSPIALDLEHVTVRYPGSTERALTDVSLAIPTTGLTAVVGASGSGKSTLAAALVGLIEPEAGVVRLAGRLLADFPVNELRRAVCLVAQNASVFSGTIAENLRLARPDATTAELLDACRNAQLDDLVVEPADLDRQVGESGSLISGGQRQRLAVARALLLSPGIYVFDEATSNIDHESESRLLHAIDQIAQHTAVVMITHQLDIAHDAQKVAVLDHGRLVGWGSAADLSVSNETYRALVAAQTHETEAPLAR